MDNLMPPPNGSPEEIQAWNTMMDTMVTFIRASTNLMNTITQKVRYNGGAGLPSNVKGLMGTTGCEPECEMCRPKSPCGVCVSEAVPPPARRTSASKAPPGTPAPPVKVTVTPPTPAPPSAEENPESGEAPEGEGEEAPPEDSPTTAAAPAKPPAAPPVTQPAGDATNECVCAAIRAKRMKEEKKDSCVCNEEDEEPPQEPAVERICGCGPTAGNQAALVQEMVQKLANAQQEINQLHEEMARLQRMDTSRRTGPHGGPNPAALYREIMRDTDRQPPPVNRPSNRVPPHVRQRLFQTGSTGNSMNERIACPAAGRNTPFQESSVFPSFNTTEPSSRGGYGQVSTGGSGRSGYSPAPAEIPNLSGYSSVPAARPTGAPEDRIPPDIRQRLFNTNSSVASHPGMYGLTPTSVRTPEDPGNRMGAQVRRRLFNTNSAGGSAPGEAYGGEGCIPCDSEGLSDYSMTPPVITSLQPPMRPPGRNLLQVPSFSPGQMQQPGSRQGTPNRLGPPTYVGGSAPCRRLPGADTILRGFQDSFETPDMGSWNQNATYSSVAGNVSTQSYPGNQSRSPETPDMANWSQNATYSSVAGNVSSPNYSGNQPRTQDSPPRRIIMCAPPPSSDDCASPVCNNRQQK